jgi:uncharacterized repeat protein (TIGR01451 family)
MKTRTRSLHVAAILALSAFPLPATQYWTLDWELIPGEAISKPSVASWAPGRLDLFWRGPDNHLKHRWVPYFGGWSWEQDLGGTLAGAPAAVSSEPDSIDVFWRGPDDHLYWIYYPGPTGDWSAAQDLSQSWLAANLLRSDPAVCSLGPGRLQVFWRGSFGRLMRVTKAPGQNWGLVDDQLGQQLAGAPTAVSWGQDRMDVFWRNPANHLQHIWFDPFGGGWHLTPEDLGAVPDSDLSDPAAVSRSVGRISLFWRSETGTLLHRGFNDGTPWSAVKDLGGYLNSAPGCASWSSQRIDVFSRTSLPGTPLQHKAWKNGPFHDFPPGVINTVVPDQTLTTGSLFEFSSAIQPPISGDSNSPARVFFAGGCGTVGCSVFYTANLLQDTLSPVTDIYPTQIVPTLLMPGEGGTSSYVPPCNTNTPVMVPLGPGADNNMTLFRDGTLMLARLLRTQRQRTDWPSTQPQALRVSDLVHTRILGGSATWLRKTDVDPADPDINNGYWQTFRCTKTKDGEVVSVSNWGGWDRNEIYADPWSAKVFISQTAARGDPQQGGLEKRSGFFARSDDYGNSWGYTLIPAGAPLMMTSLPGDAVFVSPAAKLVWSFDGGASFRPVSGPVAVSWIDNNAPQSELARDVLFTKIQGSDQISRVGTYYKNGKFIHALRFGYPAVKQGWQIYRIVAVHVPDNAYSSDDIWTENLLTLEVTDSGGNLVGNVIQVTMVEPIGAVPYANDYNTTLMYWREERPRSSSTNTTIKGQFMTGLYGFSKVLTLSTGPAGPRSFPGGFSTNSFTGHYSKGAYYYDEATQQARYLAQWIENPPGQPRSLHATILGIPKIGRGYYATPPLSAPPSVVIGQSDFNGIELKWSDCLTFDCCDRCLGDQNAPASCPEITHSLNPPVRWTPLTNQIISGGNGLFSVRIPASSPGAFFRLARRPPEPPTEVELIITAMAGPNGTLQPGGELMASPGESLTFVAVPDARFQVDAWFLDRNIVQRGGERFTLMDVATDHELTVSFRPILQYDLAVRATGHPSAVPVNSNLTYNISVENLGLGTIGDVKLTDPLPRGLNFVSSETSQGSCTFFGGIFSCDLGDIEPGATVSVTLVATPSVEGTFTNTVAVQGSAVAADENPGNNSSTVVTSTRPGRFTIIAFASSGGSIRPAGLLLVDPGQEMIFTALPEEDTEVNVWYLDHTIVQVGGETFTLSDIRADHTLSVTFVEIYD